MNHTWKYERKTFAGDMKIYVCSKCGAGPVYLPGFTHKRNITRYAKKAGISVDCNIEIIKQVQES